MVELDIAAQPTHVRTARQVAVAMGRRAGLDEATLDDVRLAVGEACGLSMALARARGRLSIRFDDGEGLAVTVHTPGHLAPAEGEAAAMAVAAAAGRQVPAEEMLGAQTALAVLGEVAPGLLVRTSTEGASVEMRWARP